jgi:hypothetical protein
VTWTSANPRPALNSDSPPLKGAGRATILATAIGEESFTDTNGNGYWDTGEPFVHLGEPYRDDNENNTYDSGEFFLDFDKSGARDAPDPALTAFKGITCTGTPATCSTSTLAIGVSHLLIMSTAQASLTNPATGGFGGSLGSGLTIIHSPAPPAAPHAGTLSFTVEDLNGNPMAAGTTVSVAADTAIGTMTGQGVGTPWTIGCRGGIGGEPIAVTFSASQNAGAGTITITVTSPGTHTATIVTIAVSVS